MLPRIVFMGSPDFAVPSLRALSENYPITGVITQPDRPSGRGKILTPSPVKKLALELGIAIHQPRRLRESEAMEQLHAWQPDLIVVAAFGQILRQEVLDLPRFGCVNVHASLLPRWRGAAPIPAAILSGDRHTGITIMIMDAGIDTGPILSQRKEMIKPQDTCATLSARLSEVGAEILLQTLPKFLEGRLTPIIQDEAGATYAGMLKKEDGLLDFKQPAEALERQIRAYQPWPGAFVTWRDQPLKVLRAHVGQAVELSLEEIIPGQRVVSHGAPAICTTNGVLILDEVQPAGKQSMPGKDFLRGAKNWNNS